MKTLSIIVPVYNVEQFIRPCVESIYRQGLDEDTFEVVLVNDGTRDNSIGVVHELIRSHRNITVVEQTNQGLSAARNTGLREAVGRYVLFLDSDDLLVPGTVAALLHTARQHDADLVVAEFLKMTCAEINEGLPPPSADVTNMVKSGPELFAGDFNPRECYVWRTLYRREFLDRERLRFVPGIYFEDVPFTVECLLKAGTCVRSSRTFYIYRQREGSIVATPGMKKLQDLNEVVSKLWQMYQTMTLADAQRRQLMNTIFATFGITVWYIAHDRQLLTRRREFVDDLRSRVPGLCFTNGAKQRVVSTLFRHFPCTYIRLRSLLSSHAQD